jgi:site-specific DNA-methyltransferase (adenine-specific)
MKLINADCIEAMKAMPDNSVDSIVTDPPYELGFMGKSWDASGIAFNVEVWREALRVIKPGGHLIAFSGSRTYHRMAVAIEDAGFQIRDQIMWVYGSGFPKSHNISKGIDKAAGAEREVVGQKIRGDVQEAKLKGSTYSVADANKNNNAIFGYGVEDITVASTLEAKQWDGWGTALKPAHEPMVLARKPLEGTVANNVLTFGVGGLNIDGSRVVSDDWDEKTVLGKYRGTNEGNDSVTNNFGVKEIKSTNTESTLIGRFPANFIHDGSNEVNELLGEPARFFYCAKASKRDRNEGLDGFENKRPAYESHRPNYENTKGIETPFAGTGRGGKDFKNFHPTVKPTTLMQYLIRLVTPPNGIVLDPFMGSGSTGKACAYEGFDFIGIDQSAEYVEIAQARIDFALADKSE